MKQIPEWSLTEDVISNTFVFVCAKEKVKSTVSREDMLMMMRELQIQTFEMVLYRLKDVCEYFIAQTQYVDFKEVKKTIAKQLEA